MSYILEQLNEQSDRLPGLTRSRVETISEGCRFNPPLFYEEVGALKVVRSILLDNHLHQEILSSPYSLTFAMIRSNLNLGKLPVSDQEVANLIMGRVKERFRTPLAFAGYIPERGAERFYGHVIQMLQEKEVITPEGISTDNWSWFKRVVTGGPTTFLILEATDNSEPGWKQWRDMIGATLAQNANPGTIRGDFGSGYNNMVHGSDSLDSAVEDAKWLAKQIDSFI